MLNMFRMLIHPSSRACDLFVELFHGVYWSVRIEVFALAYLFSGECLVVTCVVLLESVFLQILAAAVSYGYCVFFVCSRFFGNVSWIYSDVVYMSLHIRGSICVGVTLWFGWGGVVSVCRLKHYWSFHEITQQIRHKLLRMNVLTSETCWALNNEIIKQGTSSWSLSIQLSRWYTVQ